MRWPSYLACSAVQRAARSLRNPLPHDQSRDRSRIKMVIQDTGTGVELERGKLVKGYEYMKTNT